MSKVDGVAAKNKQPRFQCIGQGVRDISAEFPCPAGLFQGEMPEMALDLSVAVLPRKAPESTWDVTIALRAQASTEEGTLFLVELAYGGVFVLENVSEEQVKGLLHVEGPALLYPFARQVLINAISDGGYRPPMLDPVNFLALYMQAEQGQKSAVVQ